MISNSYRFNCRHDSLGLNPKYRISKLFDDFDKDFGESDEVDWNIAAFSNIQLQFNMKNFFFSKTVSIGPNSKFVIVYDNRDRRWYTKEKPEDPAKFMQR